MYCEKYRCSMNKSTCILKQDRYKKRNQFKKDPGCENCAQGKEIYKKYLEEKAMAEKKIKVKVCARCKKEKPADLDHFYRDRRSKTGLGSYCIACQEEKRLERAGKKKPKEAVKQPPLTGIPVPDTDKHIIILDLTDYEDLHADIKAAAEEEFREPAMQVLWWLSTRDNPKLQA